MSQYVTEAEASAFLTGNILDHEAWENAGSPERNLALIEATQAIDRLNFRGDKNDSVQVLEFPRGTDITVPVEIQNACALEALLRLDDKTVEDEIENIPARNRGFSSVRTTYDREFVQEWIANGIVSYRAWQFIKSFLRDSRGFKLSRVS
mgnify:CR=1 FL=1